LGTSTAAEQIGPYVIDAELGRGSFGVVYRAHHVDRPDMHLALKVVEGRGKVEQLMLEPALLSQFDHPCIVGVKDFFQDGGRLVIALEFIEGEDLKTLLDRGEVFSQEQIRDLLIQMASALAVAHSRNVIHRDIKPSNILVRRDGGRLRFVLTDFGIGQQVEGIQDRKHTGGTYMFMAPEQLRGRPGPQSDLWALGVVAYRMLTGRMPFPGPSLPELAHQIMYVNPEPPSKAGSTPVDAELEAAILRLLDKSLHERTASAESLLRQLGYQGKPENVLSRSTTVRKAIPAAGESLERKLSNAIWWKRFWLAIVIVIYLLPTGIFTGVLLLGGVWLFFKGQVEDRWRLRTRVLALLGSLALFAAHSIMHYVVHEWFIILGWLAPSPVVEVSASPPEKSAKDSTAANTTTIKTKKKEPATQLELVAGRELAPVIGTGVAALNVVSYLAPAIAAAIYIRLRRQQREKVLRDAALSGSSGSEQYLDLLRNALEYRFGDVGFHLKYAEALIARGRFEDAAVEARLMLVQDGYNFNANLMLANCYYSLGLLAECITVCEQYLAVSGYCFEFAELRDQCRRRMGAS